MVGNRSGRLTTGTVVILIGLFLLVATTGVVGMQSVWGWIGVVFVFLGVWSLVRSGFRNLVGPVMVIAIAGTVVLRSLGVIPAGVLGSWWPVYIVLFGVLLVLSRYRRRHQHGSSVEYSGGETSVVSVFGSDDRRLSTDGFSGAEVLAIFGSASLDLRDATPRDTPGVVEVVSIFGDAVVKVPSEWEVRLDTLTIFGDTRDRRPRGRKDTDEGVDLVVTGVSVFGDIVIDD